MLHLVTDSSCDLPEELVKKYHIQVVPLVVNIDGKFYQERVDITPRSSIQKWR